jgi:hypothetical protein
VLLFFDAVSLLNSTKPLVTAMVRLDWDTPLHGPIRVILRRCRQFTAVLKNTTDWF